MDHSFVASLAYLDVVSFRLLVVQFLVWVMTGEACHLALLEAAGHPQTIRGIGDFESVLILLAGQVEIQFVIA